MLRDIGGSLWATLVFSLALCAPGYVAAYASDFGEFRSRTLREQLAWSVALSFGIGTLVIVTAVWVAGATGGAAALTAFGLAAAIISYRVRPISGKDLRSGFSFALLAALLCVFCLLSLVDLGLSDRLYLSVTAYDNALRTAFVDAVLRTGVPPANPVYWPGHDAPMRYYYFWYVVCAAVAKLGHTSARQALIASSAWSIFGVLASVALFARHVLQWSGQQLKRRWWIAVGLLAITGFDGLIALLVYLGAHIVARDIEWWSLDQVSSWADTFLWVPHHAAALVCAVLCFVTIWISAKSTASSKRFWLMPSVAGVAFASAFGLSTYVAIGTGLVLAMCFVAQMFLGDKRITVRTYAIATTVAALCLAPYLGQLLKPQPGARVNAGSVLKLEVRELLPPVVLSNFPGISSLGISHPRAAREISAILLLVPSYFLELGFFAVALIVLQRRAGKTPGERVLLFLIWAALLSVSVLRSRVITMNDYSVRASLIPQFLLLFAGVLALEHSQQLTRIILVLLLVVGGGGSVYQVILLRTYLPIHEREGVHEYAGLAHQNFVLRDAYLEMQEKIPAGARVQFSVPNASYTGLAQQMNLGRQMIVDTDHCNDSFGGENTPCAAIQGSVASLFSGVVPVDASDAAKLCRLIGANYLAAARWDPVWKQTRGWAWTLPVIVDRPDIRIVSCAA